MAADGENQGGGGRHPPWRIAGWGLAGGLLLVPLLLGWPWSPFDYLFMSVLFGAVGLTLELAVRASGQASYRLGAGVAALTAFLMVWINAAVGIFGGEAAPANLMFLGVIAIAVVGGALARFRPGGLARAMAAAAVAQVLAAATGLMAGLATPGAQGSREALLAAAFAVPWLAAAALFRKARKAEGVDGGP